MNVAEGFPVAMYTYPNTKLVQSLYTVWKKKTIMILLLKIKKKDQNYVLAEPWGLLVQHVPYLQTKAIS